MTNACAKRRGIAIVAAADSDNFSTSAPATRGGWQQISIHWCHFAGKHFLAKWHSLCTGIAYLPHHPSPTTHRPSPICAAFAVRHFSFYLMSAPIMLFIYFVSFYLSWPVISRINSNAARLEVSLGLWAGSKGRVGGVSFLFILAALLAVALPSAHKTLKRGDTCVLLESNWIRLQLYGIWNGYNFSLSK